MLKVYFFRALYSLTKRWRNDVPTIAQTISMRTVFQERDIQKLFDTTQSWDMVLAVCGYASLMGHADLFVARKHMLSENKNVPVSKLFSLYGII